MNQQISLLTQNKEVLQFFISYSSNDSKNGKIKIEVYRQHYLIGECTMLDNCFDPFVNQNSGTKVISDEAKKLFDSFRMMTGL